MNISKQIEKKYIEAVKLKKTDEANTLRLIKSAIKDKEIEKRTSDSVGGLEDQQILSLLQTLIKQRKDSIESFKIASSDDLISKEQTEIDLINQFLPKQLSAEEIEELVKKILKENNFSSIKDMGSLMNIIKSNYAGSIDMAIASKIAKSLIGS